MDNQQFRGIIPPMVTPLKEWDTLDQDGMVRLIDHILSGGVHGLFLLGTTGEALWNYMVETLWKHCGNILG